MELTIRPLNETDYEEILVDWWKGWRWPVPERDFLPSNATGGIMVMDKDRPVCAGFMYATNSKVAWVEWIISDITYKDKEKRAYAIVLLIESLTNICKTAGFTYCYSILKNKNLIRVYEQLGYVTGGIDGTEMIKKI